MPGRTIALRNRIAADCSSKFEGLQLLAKLSVLTVGIWSLASSATGQQSIKAGVFADPVGGSSVGFCFRRGLVLRGGCLLSSRFRGRLGRRARGVRLAAAGKKKGDRRDECDDDLNDV